MPEEPNGDQDENEGFPQLCTEKSRIRTLPVQSCGEEHVTQCIAPGMRIGGVGGKALWVEKRPRFLLIFIDSVESLPIVETGVKSDSRGVVDVPLSFEPPLSGVGVKEKNIRRSNQHKPGQNKSRGDDGGKGIPFCEDGHHK